MGLTVPSTLADPGGAASAPSGGSRFFRFDTVVDPGAPPVHAPSTGPDSFILTYKYFET